MDNTPGVNMSWKDLTPIVHNVLKATAGRKDDSRRWVYAIKYACVNVCMCANVCVRVHLWARAHACTLASQCFPE